VFDKNIRSPQTTKLNKFRSLLTSALHAAQVIIPLESPYRAQLTLTQTTFFAVQKTPLHFGPLAPRTPLSVLHKLIPPTPLVSPHTIFSGDNNNNGTPSPLPLPSHTIVPHSRSLQPGRSPPLLQLHPTRPTAQQQSRESSLQSLCRPSGPLECFSRRKDRG